MKAGEYPVSNTPQDSVLGQTPLLQVEALFFCRYKRNRKFYYCLVPGSLVRCYNINSVSVDFFRAEIDVVIPRDSVSAGFDSNRFLHGGMPKQQ